MRAVSRVGKMLAGIALSLAPAGLAAQQAPPTSNTTTNDVVGPRELRNFSLPGTVTRSADQPAATAPAQERPPAPAADSPVPRITARQGDARATPTRSTQAARRAETESARTVERPAVTVRPEATQQPGDSASSPPPSAPAVDTAPDVADASASTTDRPSVPLYAWLIAALVLGVGGAFLFQRTRQRQALAGGPDVDEFVAPEPEPAIAPAPVPAAARPARAPDTAPSAPDPTPAPPPIPSGVVSTRMRPWIEIGFSPTRCVLGDQQASIEFLVELYNSGSAPAHQLMVDASAFNAGPAQDAMINGFFGQPNERGQRIEGLGPLDRTSLNLQINIPREQLQSYELAGQQVFVPIVAFNVLYRWSGGDAQTSASFLVGRGTPTDKLAPLRLDAGPRIFRGLAAKLLPTAVRR